MTHTVGEVVQAKIIDENQTAFFAQVDGITYTLEKKQLDVPAEVGQVVEGFTYENNQHDLALSLEIPAVRLGHFAYGTVTDIRRDLGVFVDIGLPDKDVVVSLDELPTLKELWPQRGDQLLITLRVDNKERLWGELAPAEVYQAMRVPAKKNMQNKNVKATVYRLKMVGTYVLTDDYHFGFIHPDERYREPRLGEHVAARVIGVRDDGTLNLSLRPRAYESIGDDAQMILNLLKANPKHMLPYNDKSDPKAIKQYFNMSKGQFKRALGNLYKQRLITQDENGVYLTENDEA
ncbi:putative RNA-binding protein (virulence factor B family) [Weissella uvarum]|uniref:CvfB family protein n=1 Tax=Weissella uvarum TaxID=1479233 RepID=UPI00195F5AE3|nr:S1-like domain-containing RNA-binding protein [Weissella uvarum]MBM7617078.1 putative RNA-binding protein (virulence factor B family) [Weissella uvarum]MCM0595376.1 DNA-binding protein [Weissella uvarum]